MTRTAAEKVRVTMNEQKIDEFFDHLQRQAGNPIGASQILLHFVNGTSAPQNYIAANSIGILVSDPGGASQERFYPWSSIFYVS
jgi:hypothetical protein